MSARHILFFLILLFFIGCKKKSDPDPVPDPGEYLSVTLGNSFTDENDPADMSLINGLLKLKMVARNVGRWQSYLDFTFQMDSVTGTGIFSASQGHFDYNADNFSAVYNSLLSEPDPNGYSGHLGLRSYTRTQTDTGCREILNPNPIQKVVITKWGNVGEYVEGTISGSLYSDSYVYWEQCLNSFEYSYGGSFRFIR